MSWVEYSSNVAVYMFIVHGAQQMKVISCLKFLWNTDALSVMQMALYLHAVIGDA